MHEPAREAANDGTLFETFLHSDFLYSPLILPGGRWTMGISGAGPEWYLSIYDLQTVVSSVVYQPALVIPIHVHFNEFIEGLDIEGYEYCPLDASFNIVVSGSSDQRDWGIAWLVRVFIQPKTQQLTYHMLDIPPKVRGQQWILGLSGDFMTFERRHATKGIHTLIWNWRSDTTMSRDSRRTRDRVMWFAGPEFILTSSGSLVQMEASHHGMEVTFSFLLWPWENLPDGEGTSHEAQSLVIQIPSEDNIKEFDNLRIKLQHYIKRRDALFLFILIGSGFNEWYLYIALEGDIYIPRILHFGGKNGSPPQELLISISEPMLSLYNVPFVAAIRNNFPDGTPTEFRAPARSVINDFQIKLSCPPMTTLLSVPVQEGDRKSTLSAFKGYCPRSGRCILSREFQGGDDLVHFSSFTIVEQPE
ncbi:hypothetical protein DL93DRAFT_2084095 [Clavulina sp. PMI_390]|nr:hypothetical protein DL93DRAFT_2084095 [Clavulina sp. PMI_390]